MNNNEAVIFAVCSTRWQQRRLLVRAGVLHALLTAIFLMTEITGGYTLFVPLMIVAALSYFITRKYIEYLVYHKALIKKYILRELPEDHFQSP